MSNLDLNFQYFQLGTVVNRALPSLQGGSLEISPTVPLIGKIVQLKAKA